MITTVTLNVAIDKFYLVDQFETGKVTRVRECVATAGGKGLNVARIVSLLGEQVTAAGFIGGHSGRYVEEILQNSGIQSDFTHVDGESRSCINITDKNEKSTELLEPGVTVIERDIKTFFEKYRRLIDRSEVVTLSGSAPSGCGADIYGKLILLAKQGGKKVLLDTSGENLRRGINA